MMSMIITRVFIFTGVLAEEVLTDKRQISSLLGLIDRRGHDQETNKQTVSQITSKSLN